MNKVKRVYNRHPETLSKDERQKLTTKAYYKRKGQLLILKKTISQKLKVSMEDLSDIKDVEELNIFVMNYMLMNGINLGNETPSLYYKTALKIY